MKTISFTKVKLPFGWLGNMSPHPVVYNDQTWPTCEALFQALRFAVDDPIREEIRQLKSPMAAKMHAKSGATRFVIEPRSDHDVENMIIVLRLKLHHWPLLVEQLKATEDALIVEDVTARPNESGLFWGAKCVGEVRLPTGDKERAWLGRNELGKLWMALRSP